MAGACLVRGGLWRACKLDRTRRNAARDAREALLDVICPQSDVESMREEAISKLDKPLEKMRIKELKHLLQVCGPVWHARVIS